MQINQLLKKRDWFMPYAPSILEEDYMDWVNQEHYSPYMQIAFKMNSEMVEKVPSAVHVDGTTRVHVVRKSENPLYWNLINEFKELTGIPVLLNTSFNRHGISTISSPRQAIEHLLAGCMDYLIISNYLVSLNENRKLKKNKYKIHTENKELYDLCLRRFIKVKKYLKSSEAKIYKEYLKKLKK